MDILKKILGQNQKFIITEEHQQCLDILENSNENLFITGKAGTGKSTLIEHFRNTTKKKVVVVAPTGIAALNVRGQTIHSFFKFPPRMIDPKAIKRMSNSRLYKDVDTIIIDEISMVRADVLDGIDQFLRIHGKDFSLPFGGVQMVFVGDLYQLPPVVTYEEQAMFNRFYDTPYFFSSNCFNYREFILIELKTIFRQKEQEFIDVLNKIRVGDVSMETMEIINNRLSERPAGDDYIILCTTNKVAEGINSSKLAAIQKPEHVYDATITGNFPTEERNIPVELELKLKVGAKVLFVKNDVGGQWVNGSVGKVHHLDKDTIHVMLDGGKLVDVTQMEWENIRYEYDEEKGEIVSTVLGTLTQYPLKLAWAITIHKSQGMSFDKVVIDFAKSPFAHGQTYVALSRCRSLDGLVLTKKIYPNDVLIDEKIREFYRKI
jgi:ATP-dependent DNA helicase PIF1